MKFDKLAKMERRIDALGATLEYLRDNRRDPEEDHLAADKAIMEFFFLSDHPEIEEAFSAIDKWYS